MRWGKCYLIRLQLAHVTARLVRTPPRLRLRSDTGNVFADTNGKAPIPSRCVRGGCARLERALPQRPAQASSIVRSAHLAGRTIIAHARRYYKGRFSNGPVYVEKVQDELHIPVLNYAHGGAKACPGGGIQTPFEAQARPLFRLGLREAHVWVLLCCQQTTAVPTAASAGVHLG